MMLRYLYILPLSALHTTLLHVCVGVFAHARLASRQSHWQSSDRCFHHDTSMYLFSVRVTLFHRGIIWQVRLITPTCAELVRSHWINLKKNSRFKVVAEQFAHLIGYDVVNICPQQLNCLLRQDHLCTMTNYFVENHIMSTCHRCSLLAAKTWKVFHVFPNCRNTSCTIVLFLSLFPLWWLPYAVTLSRSPQCGNEAVFVESYCTTEMCLFLSDDTNRQTQGQTIQQLLKNISCCFGGFVSVAAVFAVSLKLLFKSGEDGALILTFLRPGCELKKTKKNKTSHFQLSTKRRRLWQAIFDFLQQILVWKKGRWQLSPTSTVFSFRTLYMLLICLVFAGRAGALMSAGKILFPQWPTPLLPSPLANTNMNSQSQTSELNKCKYAATTFILLLWWNSFTLGRHIAYALTDKEAINTHRLDRFCLLNRQTKRENMPNGFLLN